MSLAKAQWAGTESAVPVRQKEEKCVNTKKGNWDKTLALRMYENGATDMAIAEAVGVSNEAVRQWRKKSGLPNIVHRKPFPAETFRKLYDQESVMQEFPETGCSRHSVARWRRENGLPPVQNPLEQWNKQEARRLYDMGLSDSKIAAMLGTTYSTICRWRHLNQLPARNPSRWGRGINHG